MPRCTAFIPKADGLEDRTMLDGSALAPPTIELAPLPPPPS